VSEETDEQKYQAVRYMFEDVLLLHEEIAWFAT